MTLLANAKNLRRSLTIAEQRLWYHLRAHRFMGLKFKRQKPIGRYIVDFVCVEHRLIIELDGGQHADEVSYDQQRDAWLRSEGYLVLRFWNNDVMQQLDVVLEQIRLALLTLPSPPAPLPLAGEGRKSNGNRRPSPASAGECGKNLPSPTCGRGAGGEGKASGEGIPS